MSDTSKPQRPGENESSEARHEMLPDELSWAAGGHASDVVLTALADGQRDIVLPAAREHVERCATCMAHLGHAALLSIHVGGELAVRVEHERSLVRRPFPRLAVAVGLAVAAVGLLPRVLDGESGHLSIKTFATRDVPIFLRGLGTLARRFDAPGSASGLVVTYSAAVLLVAMAFAVVRILSKAQKEAPR